MNEDEDFEFKVLDLASRRELPRIIEDDSIAPVAVFANLVGDGLLRASDIHHDERALPFIVTDPQITSFGRERLATLRSARSARTIPARVRSGITISWRWLLGLLGFIALVLGILRSAGLLRDQPPASPAPAAATVPPAPTDPKESNQPKQQ